jgi:NHL repeat
MAIGPHRLEYEVLEGWEQLPEGWSFVEVAGVAVDSRDRVYVFNRGAHPMIVFDKDGRFLDAWGEGIFSSAHGVFIDRHDHVYCADNFDHTVRKFTTDGELLMTLGDPERPADTGFRIGHSPVRYAGGPFNMVTNVAVTPAGEMFVSDGYGNARVHRFSATGELLASWGEPGEEPGQFNLPHSIAVDRSGRVFVADRENSRIQIFSADGEFLTSWDWVNRPDDLFIDEQENLYIAELGWNVPHRDVPHYCWSKHPPVGHAPIARVTICDLDGHIQTQIGGYDPLLPGNFIVPHGIWADSRGDFYVGEVVKASGAIDHFAPLTCHAFQKFIRAG